MYITEYLRVDSNFSVKVPKISKEKQFDKMWIKFAWRKEFDTHLYAWMGSPRNLLIERVPYFKIEIFLFYI